MKKATWSLEYALLYALFTDMAEYSYEGIMDYIVQVSISDNSFVVNDRLSSFRNEVMLTAKVWKIFINLTSSCQLQCITKANQQYLS